MPKDSSYALESLCAQTSFVSVPLPTSRSLSSSALGADTNISTVSGNCFFIFKAPWISISRITFFPALSCSLTYDFGGSDFAISGAYTNSDRTNEQNLQSRGTGKRAEAWATGLKYDANNIYLATFYSETRKMTPISGGFANKTQNFEAVAQYQFDFGLRPSLGYVLSKGKDIEGIGDEDLVNYVDVGATYYFNKNMSAFVDYKINQLDSDNKLNINNDDIVAVGMTYQF